MKPTPWSAFQWQQCTDNKINCFHRCYYKCLSDTFFDVSSTYCNMFRFSCKAALNFRCVPKNKKHLLFSLCRSIS